MSIEKQRLQIKYRKQAGKCPKTWVIQYDRDNKKHVSKDYVQENIDRLLKEQAKYLQAVQNNKHYEPKYKIDFVTNSVVKAR